MEMVSGEMRKIEMGRGETNQKRESSDGRALYRERMNGTRRDR